MAVLLLDTAGEYMGVGSNSCNTDVTSGASTDPGTSRRIFRFGVFELRTETGELFKHGTRVKVQIKPLRVLETLLERPGELVTREELCKRLWPPGTFVDFESGLNTATNRLRGALGDSAEAPRYIETLQRLGYRFICPVTAIEDHRSASNVSITGHEPAVIEPASPAVTEGNSTSVPVPSLPASDLKNPLRPQSMRRLAQVLTITLAVLALLFFLGYMHLQANAAPSQPVFHQLTF